MNPRDIEALQQQRLARKRWDVGGWPAAVGFLVTMGVGFTHRPTLDSRLPAIPILLFVPLVTVILYLSLVKMVPDLCRSTTLSFPLTVTLPLVFTALLGTLAELLAVAPNALMQPLPVEQAFGFWASWPLLIQTFLVEAIALSVIAVFGALWRRARGAK